MLFVCCPGRERLFAPGWGDRFLGRSEIMEDGKRKAFSTKGDADGWHEIDRYVWETLVQNGYDCVFELGMTGKEIHFLHIGVWLTDCLGGLEAVDEYAEFCGLLSEKLIVSEEKEPFLEQAAFPVIEAELRSRGHYVRTVHMDTEDGRRAKSFRVHRMDGQEDTLLCTLYDISAALDHDWMTDEYARSGFLENAQKLLAGLPDDETYSLLYTNVRGFKAVNDLFGTQSGDMVLFQVRDELRRILDPVILGRFENDHYVLIARDRLLTDENLRRLCHQTYTEGYKQYVFHIRCGIYRIVKRDLSIHHIVDRAKLAERAIRDDYGLPYAYYDDTVRVNYIKQRVLMSDMKSALHDNEFKVFFQPVVNAGNGKICSAEALIRWQHHEFGMVSPGEFVPLFETEGLISALDRFIVNRVMDFTLERVQANKRVVPCAVNLSRMDFFDPDLMKQILERVSHSELSPKDIRIEVTESAYVVLERNAMNFLSEMKKRGIRILLDDYGSGMSSLSTLESFEFDILKLDMGFIRKIGISRKAEAIIRSTIELAHAVGAQVTAEGVETEAQRQFLVDAGCDMIQGYYYYRPIPEEEFARLLEDRE